MTTYLPGYNATVTIGVGDTTIGPTAAQYDSDIGPAELAKPVLGARSQQAIAGQVTGTFTISGHGSEENMGDLAALRDPANQPFTVTATFWTSGGSESYQGVGRVQITASGDGEVDWTVSGTVAGDYTYTPGS